MAKDVKDLLKALEIIHEEASKLLLIPLSEEAVKSVERIVKMAIPSEQFEMTDKEPKDEETDFWTPTA